MRALFMLSLFLLSPAVASAQDEKVDLEIKVVSLSTKEGKFEPELKALIAGLPLSYRSGQTIDGHIKPAVAKGESVRFQLKETKEWVLVEVKGISASGFDFKVQFGEKGTGLRAKATKRGAAVIVGPVAKPAPEVELFVVITPR